MIGFLYRLAVHLPAVEEQQELFRLIAQVRVGVPHAVWLAAFATDVPLLLETWSLGVRRLERCVACIKPGDKDFEGAHRLSLAVQLMSQLAAVLVQAPNALPLAGVERMKTPVGPLIAAARLGHRLRVHPYPDANARERAIARECAFGALDAACSLAAGFGETFAIEAIEGGLLEMLAVLSLTRIETDDSVIDRQLNFITQPSDAEQELLAALGPLGQLLSALVSLVGLASAWPRFAQIVREHLAHLFVTILAPLITIEEPKTPRGAIRTTVRDHWLHIAKGLDLPSIGRPAYCWSPACPRHLPDSPDGPLQRCSGCKSAYCALTPRPSPLTLSRLLGALPARVRRPRVVHTDVSSAIGRRTARSAR